MAEITLYQFEADPRVAMRAAAAGPVVITERAAPAYVLLAVGRLPDPPVHDGRNIVEMLAMPGMEDIEFDPPRLLCDRQPWDPS